MALTSVSRRNFSGRIALLLPAIAAAGLSGSARAAESPPGDGLSLGAETIHQERSFKASPKRVYAALTDAAQFDKVVRLSMAMRAGMPPGAPPTRVSADAGGEFSLFGGYISGRIIELVPNQRIVQAWRTANWPVGVFSIARFELLEQGAGCKLVFDQNGFPPGEGPHLTAGWIANYWEPLEKYLAA